MVDRDAELAVSVQAMAGVGYPSELQVTTSPAMYSDPEGDAIVTDVGQTVQTKQSNQTFVLPALYLYSLFTNKVA